MPDENGNPTPEELETQRLRDEAAADRAAARQERLAGMLERIGAPVTIASVYQGALEEKALKDFVATLQIQPTKPADGNDNKPDLSPWERYEAGQRGNFGTPAGADDSYGNEVEQLRKIGSEAISKALPRVNPYVTQEDERVAARVEMEKVNAIHRQWAREVQQGKRDPAYRGLEGFGGRLDPPQYAKRSQDYFMDS